MESMPTNFSEENTTEWDSLSEDFAEEEAKKSPEQVEYEKKEQVLMQKLYKMAELGERSIQSYRADVVSCYEMTKNPGTENMSGALSEIGSTIKTFGQRELESFFAYVDAKYPSKYAEQDEEEADDGISDIDDMRDEFRQDSFRKSEAMHDSIEETAKVLTRSDSQEDFYSASLIRTLRDNVTRQSVDFSSLLINFVEDPTYEKREKTAKSESSYETRLCDELFGLAANLDNSNNRDRHHLFEPTVELISQIIKGCEDRYDGIMDYLKFKMQNSVQSDSLPSWYK